MANRLAGLCNALALVCGVALAGMAVGAVVFAYAVDGAYECTPVALGVASHG